MSAVIEAVCLNKNFGALHVTRNVSLALEPGARHALIGPNGAGKTTLVNLLAGALQPSTGRVRLLGQEVTALDESARTRRGLVRTFQINQLFKPLSVLENVALATAEADGLADNMWKPLGEHTGAIERAVEILEQLGLASDADRKVSELAYGRQRLIEIAIAMALKPRVLLLDEPAAGVPAADSERVLQAISTLGDDIAILIIEHDMGVVFRFATEISVLVDGALLVTGTPDAVAKDERVRAVYLGKRHV
jgi:branched-chain amino acid transport system ATP-binding protein